MKLRLGKLGGLKITRIVFLADCRARIPYRHPEKSFRVRIAIDDGDDDRQHSLISRVRCQNPVRCESPTFQTHRHVAKLNDPTHHVYTLSNFIYAKQTYSVPGIICKVIKIPFFPNRFEIDYSSSISLISTSLVSIPSVGTATSSAFPSLE